MKDRGWVVPIGALAAVALLLVVVWVILPSQPERGCACGPLGIALAIGTPTEGPQGGAGGQIELYAFPIQAASSGLVWSALAFQVQEPSGTIVTTTATGWNLTVFNSDGMEVAAYSIKSSTPAWTSGGAGAVMAGEAIFLETPVATPLHGDDLIVIVSGAYAESMSVNIP
jgi:hypothetical protein